MRSFPLIGTLVGLLGSGAVAGTILLGPTPDGSPATLPIPAKFGHLILHVAGDVTHLKVLGITPKADAYNPVRGESGFFAVLRDRNGQELGRYDLDLSRFDLEPANIGKPPRVEGCVVWDTRISTIVNVPFLPETASIEFEKVGASGGRRVLGRVSATAYRGLIARGGEPR